MIFLVTPCQIEDLHVGVEGALVEVEAMEALAREVTIMRSPLGAS